MRGRTTAVSTTVTSPSPTPAPVKGCGRQRRPLLAREPELRRLVQDKLQEEWTPGQIAAHLRESYPDSPGRFNKRQCSHFHTLQRRRACRDR